MVALTAGGCDSGEGMDGGAGDDAGNVDVDGGGVDGGGVDAGDFDAGDFDAGPPGPTATLPSRGSSIAVSEDGATLAVANRGTDDVTLFDPTDNGERARISVGDEPVSVTFSPDGATLYVVNRAGGTVSVVTAANGESPSVAATIDVGSEPVLAALSPSGRSLYVTSWVDGTLTVIDTASRSVRSTTVLGGAPYAVCVTNDGDDQDDDETIFVTDFYSRAAAGEQAATDTARNGRVFRLSAADPSSVSGTTTLEPIAVTGIEASIDAANTSAFANQLYACSINGSRLYVTAVGASPAPFMGGTDFRQNIHGLVYAINVADGSVDDGRTVNLSQLIAARSGEKRFAAVPDDIQFVNGTDFAYIPVMTANAVIRVDFSVSPPTAGSPSGANFLTTGPSPTGIAITGTTAFVYNEVGRSFTEIDLATQTTTAMEVPSSPLPAAGTTEADVLRGQRFFNTGLARWSTSAWVGCVGCHPSGTTDNVTWVFPAGPRQTVDTAATFSRDGSVQRILNWSAIFDEIHDFELNTRGVANGVGAIVSDPALATSSRIDFVGPGGVGNPTNGFNIGSAAGAGSVIEDWDQIEAYIQSIRTPHGASVTEGDPAAGRAVFETAGCANCHGGALWTLSELYFTPVFNGDLRLVTFASQGVTGLGALRADQTVLDDLGFDTPLLNNDANGAPQRHLCSVRTVGTFDADGPTGHGAAELRQNGAAAQGVDGFNVPSLLGIGLGAPYLHNGAATTLEELFDPSGDFGDHLRAGNQVFVPTATQVTDLIAFLRTIDDSTPTIPVPAGQRICPTGVVPPVP
ncbi:MAG: beta-propeller fold lactonase family protein [Sandaracinaceae bacterium]|nr:beta-propeller fold lactonase family protein [Sandaracinaceae bacterium]